VAGKTSAIRFLVARETDAAWPVASRVAEELAGRGLDVRVVATGARGPNRKADQLALALARETHLPPVVVVADSDVELSAEPLGAIVGPVVRGDADAVWAPPVESHATTAADRASQTVLDGSLQAFGLLSGIDPTSMVGKLFAIRRAALFDAGSFAGLRWVLAEDVALARRLRSIGARVRVASCPASSTAAGRSWGDVITRYRRWVAVVRSQRPALLASYPLLLAAAPLQLAWSIGLLAAGNAGAAGCLGAALVTRAAVLVFARVRSRRPVTSNVGAALAADVLMLLAFACSIASRRVRWRGVELDVARGGLLVEVGR
jgi:ceramide glucosyltransferase